MNRPTVGDIVSIVIPLLHLGLCVVAAAGGFGSEGSWGWFPVFVVDLPISIVFAPLAGPIHPFLVFGVLGTLWWFILTRAVVYGLRWLARR
jgi:hypothetical protein